MTTNEQPSGHSPQPSESAAANQAEAKVPLWRRILGGTKSATEPTSSGSSVDEYDGNKAKPEKWSMGVLNDRQTDEVPGTSERNATQVYCALPVAQPHQEIRRGPWGIFAAGTRLTQCLSRLHSPHVSYQTQRASGSAQCTSKNIHLLLAFTISSRFKIWKRQTICPQAIIRAFCGREEENQRWQDYIGTST